MNGSDDEQHDAHVKCYRLAAVAYGDAVARAARGVGEGLVAGKATKVVPMHMVQK